MIKDKILRSVYNLPAFPVTVQRVSEILADPDYAIADVVEVIQYDQSITANILKVCNSAYLGTRNKISTLREALVYLGAQKILRIVQIAGFSGYFGKTAGYYHESSKLWEHSVGVALMSQILSRRVFRREDNTLFTAGILHDIGKVVMGEFVSESFENIMNLVQEGGYSFLEAEETVLGLNHAELGGEIAALWKFPEDIRNVITYHHRPDLLQGIDDTEAWLLYLADQICLMMGIGGGEDGLAYRGLNAVIERFNLHAKDLEEGCVMLFDALQKARDFVKLV